MFSVKEYPNGKYKIGFESSTGEVVDVLPHWYDDLSLAQQAARRMTRTFSVVEVMSSMAPMDKNHNSEGEGR